MNPYSVLACNIERKRIALQRAIYLAQGRLKLARKRTMEKRRKSAFADGRGRPIGGERARQQIAIAIGKLEGFDLALRMIDSIRS